MHVTFSGVDGCYIIDLRQVACDQGHANVMQCLVLYFCSSKLVLQDIDLVQYYFSLCFLANLLRKTEPFVESLA